MIHSILVQAQAPAGGGLTTQLLFMGALIAVFYFFMIRPQQKKAKDQKKFTEEIKRGDYVVTIGGLHGRVAEIEDDTFIIEVERGGRLKYSKSAISMESTKAAAGKKTA
ncbi:MAG: preprotein translocase subunit YajC [Bacteroidota bacterium]|nr:MAG: preprotein translocase subunit YajC [Bacteroidetes bacterium OLB12]GIL22786.1 MAG: preprotein translocase subunit YajC [Bacteroidota bacterium]HNU43503.1 preprotein translocase subunit YajC [Cyclobacteriaceae bacterium]